MEMHGN